MICLNRNGTIDRSEWERGIVLQKYKIYLLLSMANRFHLDATSEYDVAGTTDRAKMLLEYKARIDKMTPVSGSMSQLCARMCIHHVGGQVRGQVHPF